MRDNFQRKGFFFLYTEKPYFFFQISFSWLDSRMIRFEGREGKGVILFSFSNRTRARRRRTLNGVRSETSRARIAQGSIPFFGCPKSNQNSLLALLLGYLTPLDNIRSTQFHRSMGRKQQFNLQVLALERSLVNPLSPPG